MATMTLRGFKAIVAGNVSSQKQRHRYPLLGNGTSSSNPGISLNDFDSDDDEPPVADTDGPHQPPRIAEWRSNLVALSQIENLYFAAYQEKIHVTVPRGLKQTISGKPDLILDPPRSKEGILVGGYIDRINGHCVNHMIVGNLGTLEILLLACDDGDVIAYYTHTIEAAIESGILQREIRPFFHENVGISAWGLAVHEKSRLIAVSSNNREVIIFRYGCTYTSTGITYEDYVALEEIELIETKTALFPTITQPQSTFRWNNFRKILKLGPEGHNIPSIDFSNDSNGEAHSVLATDIVGNLWILDLWREGEVRRLPSIQKAPTRGNGVMGWGVIVLPLAAFKRTSTPEEALGVAKLEVAVSRISLGGTNLERHFDLTNTIPTIKDSSTYHPLFGYGINGPVVTTSPNTTPTPTPLALPAVGTFEHLRSPQTKEPAITPTELHEHAKKYFEEVINKPLKSKPAKMENLRKMARFDNPIREMAEKMLELEEAEEAEATDGKPLAYHLQDRCAILRTYQDDIELIPPAETMLRTICRKVLKQALPVAIGHQVNFERLIFHTLVVELGLVIVGSQVGRVALISLTRPEDSFSHHGPVTMFRVDCILPTKKHEDENMRPHVPLLGIAVSPLQGHQMRERRRWRLILHYYDHSILSYELSREGFDLLVF